MIRVAQISDTHLSHRRAHAVPEVRAVLRALDGDDVDLVVHTGDIVADDPDDADERAFAFRTVAGGTRHPLAVIPGNHDVGGFSGIPWTPERNREFVDTWGSDTFAHDIGRWAIVGANVYRLGDADHDGWLRAAVQRAGADRRHLALYLHQPVHLVAPEVPDQGDWSLPLAARAALTAALGEVRPALVASGHLHRYRCAPGQVFAPSAAFAGSAPAPGELSVVGYVIHELHDDGTTEHRLVVPSTVRQRTFREIAGARASGLADAPLLDAGDLEP